MKKNPKKQSKAEPLLSATSENQRKRRRNEGRTNPLSYIGTRENPITPSKNRKEKKTYSHGHQKGGGSVWAKTARFRAVGGRGEKRTTVNNAPKGEGGTNPASLITRRGQENGGQANQVVLKPWGEKAEEDRPSRGLLLQLTTMGRG